MIIKSDLVTESPPILMQSRSVVTRQPTPQTATPGLDERVVILIVGLAILAPTVILTLTGIRRHAAASFFGAVRAQAPSRVSRSTSSGIAAKSRSTQP